MTQSGIEAFARTHWPQVTRAAAWLLVVITTVLSVGPETESVGGVQLSDKLLHVGVYAALALLFLGSEPRLTTPRTLRIGFAVIAFGAALELAQLALPHRTADALDLLANVAGVVLGFGPWLGIRTTQVNTQLARGTPVPRTVSRRRS